MLAYARTLVGKPFSNAGMARSILFPRQTDGSSFFCAELVASVLKAGGLLSQSSNPGAATPHLWPQSSGAIYSRLPPPPSISASGRTNPSAARRRRYDGL